MEGDDLVGHRDRRPTAPHLRAVEQRVRHTGRVHGRRVGVDVDGGAGREEVDAPGRPDALLAAGPLDLPPGVVRRRGEADVVLGVVAAADDAAVVVRRAVEVTAEAEPLQADHPQTSPGGEAGGRTAHAPEADDDHVGVEARRRRLNHGQTCALG
jgi:hypothetical protein